MLQADLAKDPAKWEQVDLSKGIVCVTTYEGKIVMYGNARLIWQIEPIKWIEGARKQFAPFERKKATYLTIRWLRDWLADMRHNPLIRGYFCLISNVNQAMQKNAVSFGMHRVYMGVKFFAENFKE